MWFFFPFKWMFTRYNCSAEVIMAPFQTLSLFLLCESVWFNGWLLIQTQTHKFWNVCCFYRKKNQLEFSTDHTFENAIDAPPFLSVFFAPLPAHWVTWAASPAICLNPRIMSRIQRWHVNTSHRPCSALRSLYKQIIPYPIAGKIS